VVRAIILHELGHLVGLDHTSDRGQIMFSEAEFNVRDYAPGDLRGLARLGTQACFPGV
jgi:predicted Zn-dependent protease